MGKLGREAFLCLLYIRGSWCLRIYRAPNVREKSSLWYALKIWMIESASVQPKISCLNLCSLRWAEHVINDTRMQEDSSHLSIVHINIKLWLFHLRLLCSVWLLLHSLPCCIQDLQASLSSTRSSKKCFVILHQGPLQLSGSLYSNNQLDDFRNR